jgi:UPF0755 protein
MAGVINALFSFIVVLLLAGGGAAYALRYEFNRPGPLESSTVIVIPQGENAVGIASRLEQEGAITDRRVMLAGYYWARLKTWFTAGKAPLLKAGEYEIPKSASMHQVLEALVEGKAILYKVKVPEGLTSWQIVQLLNSQSDLTGDIAQVPAEGSLLPETYKFSRGADRNEIITRMQSAMKRLVAEQWSRKPSIVPLKTTDEAVILASIVEKEASSERDHVASVFINRLAKKMRLQSDPTIIYALTQGKGPLGRGIYKNEIEDKNPYNTYQIDGLPPTPICNPGRASIEAVLNPTDSQDLYFVADGTGGHAFASNIHDHQKNVQRWRQIEKAQQAKAGNTGTLPAADQSAGPGVSADAIPGVSVQGGATGAGAAITNAPSAAQSSNTDAATGDETSVSLPTGTDAQTSVTTGAAGTVATDATAGDASQPGTEPAQTAAGTIKKKTKAKPQPATSDQSGG